MKRILRIAAVLIGTLIVLILLCNYVINSFSEDKTFHNVTEIPKNEVGIVLGTSKKIAGGSPNLFYTYRIDATVALFKAKKINFILVSGDNGTRYYNEPATIKKDLVNAGIPADKIFLDFAGFRTLDSVVRAKEVFGLNSVTIISQEFHNQRAIYLAEKKGLKAVGFNAKDVSGNSGLKVHIREYLARVKVFVDLTLNIKPKFYGEQIEIK